MLHRRHLIERDQCAYTSESLGGTSSVSLMQGVEWTNTRIQSDKQGKKEKEGRKKGKSFRDPMFRHWFAPAGKSIQASASLAGPRSGANLP